MKEVGSNILNLRTVKGVGAGVISAVLVMLLLSLLAAMVVYLSPLSEGGLSGIAIFINAIAIFIGGYICGHMTGSRGLLLGLIMAAVVLLLMILLGPHDGGSITLKVVYCLLSGMIGGIFGVK
jgi:putative membrane protein (TIGR04086 family)